MISQQNVISKIFILILTSVILSGCARDLSDSVYTSADTFNIVLEGQLLSQRKITIKESDRLADNSSGAAMGAVGGGVGAYSMSGNNAGAGLAGAAIGGVIGATMQQALGTTKGVEYIVRVDTSKMQSEYFEGSRLMRNALAATKATGMLTVIQADDKKAAPIRDGDKVLVIIGEKRTRIIPQNF